MFKSKIDEMNIDKEVKRLSRNFVEKVSGGLSSLGTVSKDTLDKNLHDVKEKLDSKLKSFQKQLGNVAQDLPNVAKNIIASPLYYKILMTDILALYGYKNHEKNLLEINEGKLSRKQVEDRASGNDIKSFTERKVMDLLVGLGASPKLPIVVLPGPGLAGSAFEMSISTPNYNAVKALDKFPDTMNLIPEKLFEIEGYRSRKEFKNIEYFTTASFEGIPEKYNQNKSVEDIKKELDGKELYLFLNSINIKNHFLDKIKDMNKLVTKEIRPKAAEKDLYSPLHFLAAESSTNLNYNLVMSRGADINLKNSKGDTPTHVAVASANLDFIKYAISKKADLNIANNAGKTPLEVAKDSLLSIDPKDRTGYAQNSIRNLKDIISLLTLNKSLQNDVAKENGRSKQNTSFQPALSH